MARRFDLFADRPVEELQAQARRLRWVAPLRGCWRGERVVLALGGEPCLDRGRFADDAACDGANIAHNVRRGLQYGWQAMPRDQGEQRIPGLLLGLRQFRLGGADLGKPLAHGWGQIVARALGDRVAGRGQCAAFV